MQVNYLLSGIDKYNEFYETQKIYLKKDIKQNSVITFIASTFSETEKNKAYYTKFIDYFKNIDITFKETYLIDNNVSKDIAKNYIDKSDIIFIMGGDTLREIKDIKKYNLILNLVKRNGITIGVSAGSINMAKNVALAKDIDDNIYDHSFYKGIGLVDLNIEPHFDFNNLNHNKDIIEISSNNKIICLPNESFIRIENNDVEIIGDYYIFDSSGITLNDIKLFILNGTNENYKLLEKWCSQEEIYKHFEQRILSYDEIVDKYSKRCNINSNVPVYMIYYKSEPIGIIQYKKIDTETSKLYKVSSLDSYDIDIFIGNLQMHSKKIGEKVIKLFTNYLINIKGAKTLTLVPLIDNLKAINCYKKCGYKIKGQIEMPNTIGEVKKYLVMEVVYERNNS